LRPELTDAEAIAQVVWAGVHGIVSLQITHSQDCFISLHPGMQLARVAVVAMTRGLLRNPAELDGVDLEMLWPGDVATADRPDAGGSQR
jgi:hypothetical protein